MNDDACLTERSLGLSGSVLQNSVFAGPTAGSLKMPNLKKMSNLDQTKLIESIRELTLDELQAVSGGDGGGPAPINCPCGCGGIDTGPPSPPPCPPSMYILK
jgi:hypothetical protein